MRSVTAVWIVLAALVVVILVLAGVAWAFFRFSIQRYKVERSDEQYEEPDSIWLPFRERMKEAQDYIRAHTAERVKLTSFDGLELTALYLPVEGEAKGTVLAFHGYRSLATIDFALEVEFFHRMGYRVLLPYQRSHGESQGKYVTYGVKERYDCRDWAWYLEKRFGEEEPLFLAGISMGCATVVMSMGLDLPKNVRGVIADCGFTTPWEIMAHVAKRDFHLPPFPFLYLLDLLARLRAGFSLKGADTRKALEKSRLPVLFIHGDGDDFVPLWMTQENYRVCRGEKELIVVPGAGHAQSFGMATQRCEEAMEKFLKKYGGRA